MKFATALLLVGLFAGISAHAGEERSCTTNKVQSFTTSDVASLNTVNNIAGNSGTPPAANPPPTDIQGGTGTR